MATKWKWGVQGDNVNKHRGSMSGLDAPEHSKWGYAKARERYGELKQTDTRPRDQSRPQDPGDRQAYSNDVPENSWLRGGGKGGIKK